MRITRRDNTSKPVASLITSITESAFYNCKSLAKITIPDSVISIGYCAFYGCVALEEIIIPRSVLHISYYALPYRVTIKERTVQISTKSYTVERDKNFN